MKKPEKPSQFFEKVSDLCDKKGVSVSKMVEDLKYGNSTVTHWKNGRIPNGIRLRAIADYLGTTVDDLLAGVGEGGAGTGAVGGGAADSDNEAEGKSPSLAFGYSAELGTVDISAVSPKICHNIAVMNISRQSLAKETGIKDSFISRILCGAKSIQPDELTDFIRLALRAGILPQTLFEIKTDMYCIVKTEYDGNGNILTRDVDGIGLEQIDSAVHEQILNDSRFAYDIIISILSVVNPDMSKIIYIWRHLNTDGQTRMMADAEDLLDRPRYRRGNSFQNSDTSQQRESGT